MSYKMKGFTYPGKAPIKKINLGTFLVPAGIFTGKSAPWHPGIFEGAGALGAASDTKSRFENKGMRDQMQWNRRYGGYYPGERYSARPSGWNTAGSVRHQTVAANKPKTDPAGKKV